MTFLVCDMAGHHFFVEAHNDGEALAKAKREGAHSDAVCVPINHTREEK